jgi:hypothetical protein
MQFFRSLLPAQALQQNLIIIQLLLARNPISILLKKKQAKLGKEKTYQTQAMVLLIKGLY